MLDGGSIAEIAFVELHHLFDELCRMAITSTNRRECLLVLCLIASEQQHVVDAQELEVNEFILNVFCRGTTTDDVWNHRQLITLLNGSGNGYRSGAPSYALALKVAVLQLPIDIFRVMGGNVDIFRIEFLQNVDGTEQRFRAVTLQGRQYFKRESFFLVDLSVFQ